MREFNVYRWAGPDARRRRPLAAARPHRGAGRAASAGLSRTRSEAAPMKHLFTPEGQAALAATMRLRPLLAFDFDGTLAPIVAHPERRTHPGRVSRAWLAASPRGCRWPS
ncbi:MAG: hypothetical protein MZW92_70360 [Comamonadaceae bacterium]|nr:hypothetical protein [Comamonadaceae bacterium]